MGLSVFGIPNGNPRNIWWIDGFMRRYYAFSKKIHKILIMLLQIKLLCRYTDTQ